MTRRTGLPNLLIIGAMKCGTSALHRLLSEHPQVCMAEAKELNFFFGPEQPPDVPREEWWREGQWHRGVDWYAEQFDASAPVRGESSPGYTDPSHPGTAERIARVLPAVRLVYLTRDPLQRALSQWRHHVRDRTEKRPAQEALLDPGSQYVARSRYFERLAPFLAAFPAGQVMVVVQERLRAHTDREVRRVLAHAGADPRLWQPGSSSREAQTGNAATTETTAELSERFAMRVRDDVDALRRWMGDDIPEWRSVLPTQARHRGDP